MTSSSPSSTSITYPALVMPTSSEKYQTQLPTPNSQWLELIAFSVKLLEDFRRLGGFHQKSREREGARRRGPTKARGCECESARVLVTNELLQWLDLGGVIV
ncbi:uncharacterized protein LOC125472104 [Pyrus x bretschneideri]|uniref:uncharacterized protein LOC125472104 n=1 Tax=Pyrus x bretschneideri TaxID=225117 RepID=UPI002030EA67|nr:uncharacterized protein LOC125472104 [Pyrus x bretschneideri]